jgi:uncharacterized protein (TIGR02145 family)
MKQLNFLLLLTTFSCIIQPSILSGQEVNKSSSEKKRLVNSTIISTVTSATGRIWMDRNLGSSQVAKNHTDSAAYGDLYQWGRITDGHQKQTSQTILKTSSSPRPEHNNFITNSSHPNDWVIPQNNKLWKGVSADNNPCPQGFRLPTKKEWKAEISSWTSKDSAGAFASPLKLVAAGYRYHGDGTVNFAGTIGFYWTGNIRGHNARYLYFCSGNAYMHSSNRASGFSVRCIKD